MAAPCRGAVTAPTAVFLVFTGFLLISNDTFGGRHLRPLESTATATRLTHSPRILRTSTQVVASYVFESIHVIPTLAVTLCCNRFFRGTFGPGRLYYKILVKDSVERPYPK
eukprot:89272-Amorphochlora_amoeboformis.AAC.1